MLTSGDVADVDLGVPEGREAGVRRPAVVVTAQKILSREPTVVHVVPLTTAVRGAGSEVAVSPHSANGLMETSAAQCQHIRAVSADRVAEVRGNVGPTVLAQIRETIAVILDLP
jgi:mRNA interferase MazF